MNIPKNKKTLPAESLPRMLDPLRPLVKRIATVCSIENSFLNCLISSFVKTFEFVDLASKQEPETAFFMVPALRGITEDIIYFRFLSPFPNKIRGQVVSDMHLLELSKKSQQQNSFFKTFRPVQPVLPQMNFNEEEIKDRLRLFWRQNGWPNLYGREVPPVRQIAEKSEPGLLEVVYDFIYRLTSNMVHFDPQVLLRAGWGKIPEGPITFSYSHMGPYYLAVSRIYGSCLLCLYFEFFDKFLGPSQEEEKAVAELRRYLLVACRWPEMVTFEEMNLPVPFAESNIILRATLTVMMEEECIGMLEDGFVAGARKMLNKNHNN